MAHPTETASGPAIAARIQRGDREAFGALVERFHDLVHSVALAHTRNPDTADDVTQETFLHALQSIHRLRDPNRVDRWLVVIARNTARSMQRRAAKAPPLDSADAERIPSNEPDVARTEMRALVRNTMTRLKPKQREVLFLHYFAGRSTNEIAQTLSISRHAAKKRLERARADLGERIVRELGDFQEPRDTRNARIKRVLGVVAAGVAPKELRWAAAYEIANTLEEHGMIVLKTIAIGSAMAALGLFGAYQFGDEQPKQPLEATSTSEPTPVIVAAANAQGEAQAEETETPAPPATTAVENDTEQDSEDEVAPRLIELPRMTPTLQRKLNVPLSLEFDGQDIATIIKFVGGYTKINFAIDWRVLEPKRRRPGDDVIAGYVHVDVPPRIVPTNGYATDGIVEPFTITAIPASEVLFQILEPLGLSYVSQPGFMWVSTPAKIRSVPKVQDNRAEQMYKAASRFNKSISVQFDGGHIYDALNIVHRETNGGIVIDWQVVRPPDRKMWVKAGEEASLYDSIEQYDSEGYTPGFSISDGPMAAILDAMLTPIGLDFVPMNDFLWVSSLKRIRSEAPILTVPAGLSTRMSAALNDSELSIEFADECLERIVDFIDASGRVGISIEFDAMIDAAELNIPFIKLDDVPLRSILFALLRPLNLDYEVRGDTIIVVQREQP